MDYEHLNGMALRNLGGINIVLGKNGCGKSYLFKQAESVLRHRETIGQVRYVSPERAGFLEYQPNVDLNIGNTPGWLDETRRRNQSENFKQQSTALYRRLELMTLKEIERASAEADYVPTSFDAVIDKINTLLDRVRIQRVDHGGFTIVDKTSGVIASAQEISSGESELISLAIEFLAFVKDCDKDKTNFLFVDEPDVHLHPDLQDRLARFILAELTADHIVVVLATHSTPLVSALAEGGQTHIAFMRRGDNELSFRPISDILERVLPMFGAHPLSNIFNNAPILIVEGEDDERVWQQAVRSSRGAIRAFPCVADSIERVGLFETEANNVMSAVYDNARGYSLRDRDLAPEAIEDVGHIIRMRLSCRASENLMLSDDALALAGTDWGAIQAQVEMFVRDNGAHRYHTAVQEFAEGGFDRKGHDLKDIRNILAGFMTNKPWEVLVGQAISELVAGRGTTGTDSLKDYLGERVCSELLKLT